MFIYTMTTRPRTTAKSAQTREHILRTASRIFGQEGFHHATMRGIAGEAGVALGLIYRYFPGKEDLALALYGELAVALAAHSESWGPATLADGFARAMREKLRLVEPHRDVLGALFAASLGSHGEEVASVVGERSAAVRTQVRWAFRRVVEGATDLPASLDDEARQDLATALYGLHLAILLVRLVERSGGGVSEGLLDAATEALQRATPFIGSSAVRPMVGRAARWLDSFLGDGPPPVSRRS
jgi:AcrR family transcriptional regulator